MTFSEVFLKDDSGEFVNQTSEEKSGSGKVLIVFRLIFLMLKSFLHPSEAFEIQK